MDALAESRADLFDRLVPRSRRHDRRWHPKDARGPPHDRRGARRGVILQARHSKSSSRHCENASDESNPEKQGARRSLDRFASLAMTRCPICSDNVQPHDRRPAGRNGGVPENLSGSCRRRVCARRCWRASFSRRRAALAEIEGATSGAPLAESGSPRDRPRRVLDGVPYASFVNAAFAYWKPREPNRFNVSRGAWMRRSTSRPASGGRLALASSGAVGTLEGRRHTPKCSPAWRTSSSIFVGRPGTPVSIRTRRSAIRSATRSPTRRGRKGLNGIIYPSVANPAEPASWPCGRTRCSSVAPVAVDRLAWSGHTEPAITRLPDRERYRRGGNQRSARRAGSRRACGSNSSASNSALTTSVASSRGSGHCASAPLRAPAERGPERAPSCSRSWLAGEHVRDPDVAAALRRRDAEGPARRARAGGRQADRARRTSAIETRTITLPRCVSLNAGDGRGQSQRKAKALAPRLPWLSPSFQHRSPARAPPIRRRSEIQETIPCRNPSDAPCPQAFPPASPMLDAM